MAGGFSLNRSRQVPAEDTPAFGGIAERFRRAGDLDRAIALCRDGLKKFPALLSARVTLGWALLDKGQYDEARVELEQVLRRAPDNLAAIRGLAELHERSENAVSLEGHGSWHEMQAAAEAHAASDDHAAPAESGSLHELGLHAAALDDAAIQLLAEETPPPPVSQALPPLPVPAALAAAAAELPNVEDIALETASLNEIGAEAPAPEAAAPAALPVATPAAASVASPAAPPIATPAATPPVVISQPAATAAAPAPPVAHGPGPAPAVKTVAEARPVAAVSPPHAATPKPAISRSPRLDLAAIAADFQIESPEPAAPSVSDWADLHVVTAAGTDAPVAANARGRAPAPEAFAPTSAAATEIATPEVQPAPARASSIDEPATPVAVEHPAATIAEEAREEAGPVTELRAEPIALTALETALSPSSADDFAVETPTAMVDLGQTVASEPSIDAAQAAIVARAAETVRAEHIADPEAVALSTSPDAAALTAHPVLAHEPEPVAASLRDDGWTVTGQAVAGAMPAVSAEPLADVDTAALLASTPFQDPADVRLEIADHAEPTVLLSPLAEEEDVETLILSLEPAARMPDVTLDAIDPILPPDPSAMPALAPDVLPARLVAADHQAAPESVVAMSGAALDAIDPVLPPHPVFAETEPAVSPLASSLPSHVDQDNPATVEIAAAGALDLRGALLESQPAAPPLAEREADAPAARDYALPVEPFWSMPDAAQSAPVVVLTEAPRSPAPHHVRPPAATLRDEPVHADIVALTTKAEARRARLLALEAMLRRVERRRLQLRAGSVA